MKKLFTLFAALMACMNSFAVKYDIGVPTNNADGVFDATTNTITFEEANSYKPGWWLAWNQTDQANTGQDFSKYDSFVVELEPTDFFVTLVFEYVDATLSETSVMAKDGKLALPLNTEGKSHVKQAYLRVGEDGVGKSVKFISAYFQNAEEEATSAVIFETPATEPLGWDSETNMVKATLTDDAKSLLVEGNVLRIEYTAYPYESDDDKYYQVQVMGSWWTILNSTYAMAGVEEGSKNAIINLDGSGVLDVTLNATDISTLKQQGAVLLAGHGILVQKITVMKPSSTGISNTVLAPLSSTNAAIYNLSGQKVDSSYKGVVIQNGKKFVQK